MLKLLLDENFDHDILRGVLRRQPDIDFLRIQDLPEILSAPDPIVLEWAAKHNRVVVTHDVQTMVGFAYERVAAGETMPGVIEVRYDQPLGLKIEDFLILLECTSEEEMQNQVRYIPFK